MIDEITFQKLIKLFFVYFILSTPTLSILLIALDYVAKFITIIFFANTWTWPRIEFNLAYFYRLGILSISLGALISGASTFEYYGRYKKWW